MVKLFTKIYLILSFKGSQQKTFINKKARKYPRFSFIFYLLTTDFEVFVLLRSDWL